METNINNLLDLKDKIETAKTKKAELTGELKSKLKELKDKFNVSTIEEAKNKIKRLTDKKEKLISILKEGLIKLEKKYEW